MLLALFFLMKRWKGKKGPVENHPADLALSVEDGDSEGILVDQGFVSLMPPLPSFPLRAGVSAVLEMLLASWSLSCRGHPAPLVLAVELGWLFCTSWAF